MKTQLIESKIKNHSPRNLIVYFSGWGMPPTLVYPLALPEGYDLLICYDYQDLNLSFDFSNYKKIRLVAWSMGVWVAEQVLQHIRLTSATAINGTGMPCDDHFGIPRNIFLGTLENLSETNLLKFQRRICGDKHTFTTFQILQKQMPKVRTLENLKSELTALFENIQSHKIERGLPWTRVIISEQDRIFPVANQYHYWQTRCHDIAKIQASHYPFDLFSSWSALWR